MTRLQIRQLNRGQARRAFFTANAADFPPASPGGKAAARMGEVIASIQARAATQISGEVSRSVGIKDERFYQMKRLMRKINRAADSLGDEIEGIEELFPLPHGRSEEAWLASARAFHKNSAANEAAFFDYDLAETFRADLQGLINSMDAASDETDISEEQRGGATGGLAADFKELGKLGRRANGIVLNKYEDDPQKLAEWLIASHLKKASEHDDDDDAGEPGK